MSWDGVKLRSIAKEKGMSLSKLSEILNVSRQTVNDWTKGQVPNGSRLIDLSRVLEVTPSFFFPDEIPSIISVPLHRKRGVAKVTETMKQDATLIAKQYEKLFKWAREPGLVPILRIEKRDGQSALALAEKLRELSGINNDKPMDYEHTFHLLFSLEIVTIFRYFPKALKGYVFYSKIHNHRVVFVNNDTNLLDLIFPLLHETIHAIRDEEGNAPGDPEEETFCDMVANHVQFPMSYIRGLYNTIKESDKPRQINLLKEYSAENSHSMFGVLELLKDLNPSLDLQVGGANTNLKKQFPSIGDILFREKDARSYVQKLRMLSPHFVDMVASQMSNVTTRKSGDWLGLDSKLDADLALEELKRIASGTG